MIGQQPLEFNYAGPWVIKPLVPDEIYTDREAVYLTYLGLHTLPTLTDTTEA